jgi:hypothetical protein
MTEREVYPMQMDSRWTFAYMRQTAAEVGEAAMVSMLWLMLSMQAVCQWLFGGQWLLAPRRQRAQGTIEILIAMAVLGVLALAVWRVIGPAVMTRANGIATDLNTAGSGATGTGG